MSKRKAVGKQMSKIERFSLLTAIIGLVADVIGISTFLAAVWATSSLNVPSSGIMVLFHIASPFLFLYAWFSICWFTVRRSFLRRNDNQWLLSDTTYRTVLGTGLLLSPLLMVWWTSMSASSAPSTVESLSMIAEWAQALLPVFIICSILGSVVLATVVSLLPVIHTDMPKEPIEKAFRRPFHLLAQFLERKD